MNRHLAPKLYGMVKHFGCHPGTLCTQGKLQQRSSSRAWEACWPPYSFSWAVLGYRQNSCCPGRHVLMICAQLFPASGKVGFYGPLIPFVLFISAHFILSIFPWSALFSGSFIVIIQNMNRSEYPLSYECNQFWVFNCNFFSIKIF